MTIVQSLLMPISLETKSPDKGSLMTNRNPIFSHNRLKLGIFCTNGKGASLTLAPEAHQMTWALSVETAQMADRAGYEAVVPFSRWKGYVADNPNHVSGEVLDAYTWAAAIAQATERIGVFVTSHAPTMHPIMAAKQTATIDIISDGRLGLNVVGGWNKPELEMFGAPLKEHSERYDHLAEWLEVIERLWTENDEFDFHGKFFDVVRGISLPKPLQKPRIPIMNAGGSERGRLFACEHADMCFIAVKSEDPEQIRAEIDSYKRTAREQFNREVQVWTHCIVIQRETQNEAEDFLRYIAVEQQDREGVDGLIQMQQMQQKGVSPEGLELLRTRIAAGAGGFPLVGTAEHIAKQLELFADAGLDGILMIHIDYKDGMTRFNRDVLPKLEQAGLRRPHVPTAILEPVAPEALDA
jgi:alkanesulfonate monooxygenase SsuD/methylene tetrahydromethanopterin reductase-like flavin-dependent oxidoreductase (luciferase family)